MDVEKRALFYGYLDGIIPLEAILKIGGTSWANSSYNIRHRRSKCPNGCLYCYVRVTDNRSDQDAKRLGDIEDLVPEKLILDPKKTDKKWRIPKKPKTIMFPSLHDTFLDTVEPYIVQVKRMIDVGHNIICVSKPLLECVQKICAALGSPENSTVYMSKFIFRFSIGSIDNKVLKAWEPKAPGFDERFACLRYAFEKGFKTSISMEPFLDIPDLTVSKVMPYVTDGIWIGLMNYRDRTDIVESPGPGYDGVLDLLYSEPELRKMVVRLRGNAKVFWMNSIVNQLL